MVEMFEEQLMSIQVSMVSLGLEYVQGQAEKIYIYVIADSLHSFNLFFQIKEEIVKIHKVNTVLPHPVDVSNQMMFALLDYGIEDISTMIQLCQKYQREHPTEMWLIYDNVTNSLDVKYSYEGRYSKDEELLPRLEFDKWFKEVKQIRL